MARSNRTLGIVALLWISVTLLVAGCGQKSASLGLQDALRQYQRAVQWSDFIVAAEFLPISDQEKAELCPSFKDIKVTDYQVRTTSEDQTGVKFNQLVEIQFYVEPSIYQQSIFDRQIWEFNKEKQRWFLTSGLPNFQQEGAAHK